MFVYAVHQIKIMKSIYTVQPRMTSVMNSSKKYYVLFFIKSLVSLPNVPFSLARVLLNKINEWDLSAQSTKIYTDAYWCNCKHVKQ